MVEEKPTRSHRRFNVSLPLWVRFRRELQKEIDPRKKASQSILEEEQTTTMNISSGGCFFYVFKKPPLGTPATMVVDVPGRLSGVQGGKVLCHGKVVRVNDQEPQGKVGVACTIDGYTFKPARPI
jgi:hypothetical protein